MTTEALIRIATEGDAVAIAALRNRARQHLGARFHHQFACVTIQGVLREMKSSRTLALENAKGLVGTLRLATKKPWAIDVAYFTEAPRPLYLHDLAVDPDHQHQGLGRMLIEEAKAVARDWPSQAIRLDAYDAPYGAGAFYAKCGFREMGRATYRKTPLIYFELLIAQAAARSTFIASRPRSPRRSKSTPATRQD